MVEKIDVLAVIDRLLAVANGETEDAYAYADGHDAYAAVAKLIEAARDVERRAGPDREPRLRAAIAMIAAAPKLAGD